MNCFRSRYRRLGCAVASAAALAFSLPAAGAHGPEELQGVLETLMSWMPGEFDNAAQVAGERDLGTPEENIHQRIYRAYYQIDAPAIGEHVLLFEVRNGGKQAPLDMAEFQLWIVSVDVERNAVRMSPRRFVDANRFVAALGDTSMLSGLAPSDLKPSEGAAGCEIWWRPSGEKFVGHTDAAACKHVSRSTGKQLDFAWEFTLSKIDQWISFAGRDATGKIVFGRQDQTPWHLEKMNVRVGNSVEAL